MKYQVFLTRDAKKDIRKLTDQTVSRIYARLVALADEPRAPGTSKLRDDPAYRVRVGDYRIIFDVDDGARTVHVLGIRHRREAYRKR